MKILVVEDQPKMAQFIQQGLKAAGYQADIAGDGRNAEEMLAGLDYDLVLLDLNLPDQTGFSTAQNMRRDGYTKPILILTALNTTRDKVHGLDSGADDYLTKPFEFEELLARIRALARRRTQDSITKLTFADLEMDLIQRSVRRGDSKIELTPKEFAMLEYFLRHPQRPLTRVELAEHVWDTHFDSESNVIDVYINLVRKKIDAPFSKKLLHTVIGYGYVLKEPEA